MRKVDEYHRYVTPELVKTYIERREEKNDLDRRNERGDFFARCLILVFLIAWSVLIIMLGK